MATINGGTISLARGPVTVLADGSAQVQLNYSNSAGVVFHRRVAFVAADGSVIKDQFGNVIATPAPTALMSAITSFASQLDTTIANGAAAGKLNL